MLSLFKTLFVILLKPFGPQWGGVCLGIFHVYSPLLCYHLYIINYYVTILYIIIIITISSIKYFLAMFSQ